MTSNNGSSVIQGIGFITYCHRQFKQQRHEHKLRNETAHCRRRSQSHLRLAGYIDGWDQSVRLFNRYKVKNNNYQIYKVLKTTVQNSLISFCLASLFFPIFMEIGFLRNSGVDCVQKERYNIGDYSPCTLLCSVSYQTTRHISQKQCFSWEKIYSPLCSMVSRQRHLWQVVLSIVHHV
jgi:hypothetical protein